MYLQVQIVERLPTGAKGTDSTSLVWRWFSVLNIHGRAHDTPVTRETALATEEERQVFIATLPTRLIDVLRRRVEQTPDAPVIYSGPDTHTYAELGTGVDAAIDVLRNAGVRAGDGVLLVIENGFAGICCLYATLALDAWGVLSNVRLMIRERDVMIDRARPRLVVCAAGMSPDTHELAPAGSVRFQNPAIGTIAVSPAEVEAVLNTYPDVLQSAVVGRAVPGNEEVIGFVEPISGAEIDVDALSAYAAERLAPYKQPSRIEVMAKLPVGTTGKLLKLDLRALAEGFGGE